MRRDAKTAIGSEPGDLPLDPIPMVMEAVVDCKMADGKTKRYILTGPMRAHWEEGVTHFNREVGFIFQDPAKVDVVVFDA